jgi:hypothetical protein
MLNTHAQAVFHASCQSIVSRQLVTVHILWGTYAEYDYNKKCRVNSDHSLQILDKFLSTKFLSGM